MKRIALLACWLISLAGAPALAQQGTSPHGAITIGTDCNACHRTEAWSPLRDALAFSHSMQTDFPLTGSHQRVACASCHIDLRFDEPHASVTECATCHVDVHQGAYSETCADCHNTTLFQDVEGIGVHAQTSFPLTGTHAQLTCISCHTNDVGGAFSPIEAACVSCHEPDYEGAISVDHVAAGFPLECETCHNTVNWQGSLFDHLLASNGFDLLGAHEQEPCSSCHRSPDLAPIFTTQNDQDCISCHQPDYEDKHAGSGFPTTCLECHSTETWDGAVFDHVLASEGFALIGAHEALACESCHRLPNLEPIFSAQNDQDCISCHQPDYNDNHAGSGFPTTCLNCHNINTWDGADFDHVTASNGFDLLGAHDALACETCHSMPDLTPLFNPANDQDCITCHQPDYNDNHAGSGFPTTCLNCHNINTWDGADFDHVTASNGFDLLGAHDALACETCHSMPDLTPLFNPANDQDCITCHQPDYNDNHAGSGFPTTCLNCHNINTWGGADFDHVTASNGFDLLGAHDALACETCHSMPDLTPLFNPANDQDCITCHQPDYNDNHAGSGFPTTCLNCHNITTWGGADFDHVTASNGFDLLGAHDALACETCHSMPDLTPLFNPANDQDCITCHQPDYNDNHAGSGFPTTCLNCHNINTWDGADFDHVTASNGFDLLGAHDALACETCHSMPDLTPLFNPANDQDCITCHQPDYNDNHAGSGFPTTCLNCHNINTWDGADFDHVTASNGFDLLGAHDALACETCHSMPDLTPLFNPANDQDCITCHQQDYTDQHTGTGFPDTCIDCHTTTAWSGATFDHDDLYFPIYSGKHNNKWSNNCQTCHMQPNNYADFSCEGACHEHTKNEMDNKHQGRNGYAFDFPLCLNCHPNGN